MANSETDTGPLQKVNSTEMDYDLGKNINDLVCKLVNSREVCDGVYHYTNANSLQSIITNKSLWVTKSDFLNDRTEYKYAIQIINNILTNQNYKNLQPRDIYIIKDAIKSDLSRSFVFSLSTNRDSVNLWSNYAQSGGYNIEFNMEELSERENRRGIFISGNNMDTDRNYNKYWIGCIDEPNSEITCHSGKVIYEKNEQEKLMKDALKQLDEFNCNYKKCVEKLKDTNVLIIEDFYERKLKFTYIVTRILSSYIQLFKKNVFKLDQEYRIIFSLNKNVNAIKYRAFKGVFIPYIEVCFADDLNHNKGLPIKGITIGPKNNLDIAQRGLKSFLLSQGYHFKSDEEKIYVKRSDVPLRY